MVVLAVIEVPDAADKPGVPVPAHAYVEAPLAVKATAVPPGVQ